jgi:hypothetical protein
MIPSPPLRAIAIAILSSVTVSMGLEIMGILSVILSDNRVFKDISFLDLTLLKRGHIRMSSKEKDV